ncbi:8108_t:CDS:2 [Funneliformis caledonium]|uniref:8108_t:CDS:1 n=1 Tax=Funneliformis caledonium TaxID=1117310 RepID=A0A9N9AEL3_9GLOM|nr:8108_t:CDS:2 [Funneliformis caledonium]
MKKIRFTKEEDNVVKEVMEKLKQHNQLKQQNPYAIIENELAKFSFQRNSKQIRQRWKNHLDPNLWKEPLKYYEKDFIVQWVEKNKEGPNGTIRFAKLIPVMKNRFGKLYSENNLKNFWNSRERRRVKRNQQGKGPKLQIYDEITKISPSPLASPLSNQAPLVTLSIPQYLLPDANNSPSRYQAPPVIRPIPRYPLEKSSF